MALEDSWYASYLTETHRTFFATLVDPVNGGTYGFPGHTSGAKGHQWQNGYHVAEHALVGYITSSRIRDEPLRLYFAFADGATEEIAPAYYFDVAETGRRALESLGNGLRKVRVEFGSTR